jgi:hypothetical protein
VFDRSKKKITREIRNPSPMQDYPFSFSVAKYDYEKMPFVFFRDHQSVSVVDVKSMKAYLLMTGKKIDTLFMS